MAADEAHERAHDEQRCQERHNETDRDDADVAAGEEPAILVEIQHEGPEHRRDGQEEGKLRRRALFAFTSSAPAIVAPERDTPGTMARHWKMPIASATHSGNRMASWCNGLHVVAVERGERHAADDQHDADQDGRIEQHGLDEIVQRPTTAAAGMNATIMERTKRRASGSLGSASSTLHSRPK